MRPNLSDNRGFTLIEILVVLALTMIIMGLVFGPLISSFNLTHQAEIMVRAQDDARQALSQVSRDLGQAMYVYDNTQPSDEIECPVVDQTGAPTTVLVQYAKVDMVLPRMRGYCPLNPSHTPGGVDRGNEAQPVCPVDKVTPLVLKPLQPLSPDNNVVRYFVGLRDPSKPYSNGYLNKLTTSPEDNTYVLYRVEFSPADADNILFPKMEADGKTPRTMMDNLNDPHFFYNTATNSKGVRYCDAWKKIVRPVVTLDDTDLVRIEYVDQGSGTFETRVTPTVRFAPTAIFNDPLAPTTEESDDPENGNILPTMYKATYGQWVQPYEVRIEPDPNVDGIDTITGDDGKPEPLYSFKTKPDASGHMGVYRIDNSGKVPDALVFDMYQYQNDSATSTYRNATIVPAAVTPQPIKNGQRAFTVDTVRGVVDFAFPVIDTDKSKANGVALSKVEATSDIESTEAANPTGYRRMLLNTDPILENSTIVASSVKLYAPDTRPSSFGDQVLYTRLPFMTLNAEPEPNQYTVDIYYDRDIDGVAMKGIASINFQTSHNAGQDIGVGLPTKDKDNNPLNAWAYYEVQNNKQGDSLRANYVTKSLMTVNMGIRIYNSSNHGKPENVELVNKVHIRNIKS